MLLSSDGLTTTLLEACAGEPVRVCRARHHRLSAARAPAGAAALLRCTDPSTLLLVRRSALGTRDGRVLSENHVVARPTHAAAADCLSDASTPLGPALKAAGTPLARTVLDAGRTPWPHGPGEPAVFKTYLLWHRPEEPLAVIREVFHPGDVPAAMTGAAS